MKKKIVVRGPIFSVSGYGHHARIVLRALRRYEDLFDIYVLPCTWGATSWQHEDTEERKWLDELVAKTAVYQQQKGQYDISAQVTIPNEYVGLAPINIGITAGIETNLISPEWVEKSNHMDRIIVVSEFAKKGFVESVFQAQNKDTGQIVENFQVMKPVTVVNYPALPLEASEEDRSKFSFETDFNFLTVAQWGPRKNIENTILWFVEEFVDKPVGLVCKITQRNNSVMDRFATEKKIKNLLDGFPNRKCQVYLLHGFLSEKEMAALYTHPKIKAIINLSHGEGAGLPLLDAASYGLPVIAPDWSGYLDFLQVEKKDKKTGEKFRKSMFATVSYELKNIQKEAVWDKILIPESKWAFPEKGSYKMRLREVFYELPRYVQQAKVLQRYIRETFTEERCYKEYAEGILGESVRSVKEEDLPKISVITSVYDGVEYLPGYFEDIKRQTLFERSEFILIHPKTSTGFVEEEKIILAEMDKCPGNVKYRQLETDPGLYGCWNEAIGMSTGGLITNWNLDDRRAAKNFEKCARELYFDESLDCVYYDWVITNVSNETFEKNSSAGKRYNFPQYSFEVMKMMNVAHAGQFYRKSVFDRHGLFDAKYKSAGDWEMNLRIAQKGCKFKKMEDVLGVYYFSPKGISTNPANNKWKREEEREVFKRYKELKVEEK